MWCSFVASLFHSKERRSSSMVQFSWAAAKAKPNVHVGLAGLEASGSRRGVETIWVAAQSQSGPTHLILVLNS